MKKLLLVDDSKTFISVMNKILSSKFEIVGTANDGNEGYSVYTQTKPDLVLLDITMPNCNGKECLKKIISYNKQAKIVMVSSVGDDKTINECIQNGAIAFIKKEDVSLKCEEKIKKLILRIEEVFKAA
jgi:two-component system chemotaxis response regulator CheY